MVFILYLTGICNFAIVKEFLNYPSKHTRSDSHPGRVSWKALARSGSDDSCTLACFRTGSVWPKPDTVSHKEIGSRLVSHNIIQDVCGRTRLSLKMGNW